MSKTDHPLKQLLRIAITGIAAWLLQTEVRDAVTANIELSTPPDSIMSDQVFSYHPSRWNRKIKHLLHIASRNVIDYLVSHGIGTLVIGYNEGWKQAVALGRPTNQAFVQISFMQLVQCLPTRRSYSAFGLCCKKKAIRPSAAFLIASQ